MEPVLVPAIEIEPVNDNELAREAARLPEFAWAIVTSPNGAARLLDACRRVGTNPNSTRWAAVGSATAGALRDAGVADPWLPSESRGRAIADELPLCAGDVVLVARAERGDPGLVAGLRDRDASVCEIVAYRTVEGPDTSRQALRDALTDDPIAAVLFASGSAVRGLLRLAAPDFGQAVLAIPAICIGPGSAESAAAAGFRVLGAASSQHADALAARTAELLRASPGVLA